MIGGKWTGIKFNGCRPRKRDNSRTQEARDPEPERGQAVLELGTLRWAPAMGTGSWKERGLRVLYPSLPPAASGAAWRWTRQPRRRTRPRCRGGPRSAAAPLGLPGPRRRHGDPWLRTRGSRAAQPGPGSGSPAERRAQPAAASGLARRNGPTFARRRGTRKWRVRPGSA